MTNNIIASNKKAYRDYFITDQWECGLILNGPEVKSVRAGEVNFADSFARVEKGEIYLYNLHINPYGMASHEISEPDRVRKLLLHKREIKKIAGLVTEKGFILIPTKIYFNNRGYCKLELVIAKGKKLHDKRESIKKRQMDRDLDRTLRHTQKKREK